MMQTKEGLLEGSRGSVAMDVEDGRHFQNSMDDESEAKDWQPRLAEALAFAKSRLLEERHSKGSWAEETKVERGI